MTSSLLNPVSRRVIAILLLAAFGIALLPFQLSLHGAQQATRLRRTVLDLDLREKVGQMGFLAALSGFRSGLAAILWIEAYNAWERTEWGRMAGLFDTVTTLSPRSEVYWDLASWHMAYNASVAAREDARQPSEALRIRAERQYFNLGRDILERGIRNNPDNAYLQHQLGVIHRDKLADHENAANAFLKAARLPGARPYYMRVAGYELSKCPGREQEAYALLKSLYDKGPKERMGTLITILKELEKKLDVPQGRRIQ